MSPFYFLYGSEALLKYYDYCRNCGDSSVFEIENNFSFQQKAHIDLLNAVRLDSEGEIDLIFTNNMTEYLSNQKTLFCFDESKCNTILNENEHNFSNLEGFAKRFAGIPVIYGVCLQNQHVNARQFDGNLNIKTGKRPFLYRHGVHVLIFHL